MIVPRTPAVLGLALVGIVALAGPAHADALTGDDPFVVVTGELALPAGRTSGDAVIFNGDATIDGDVRGQVIAFNGDVTVTGDVEESVVATNGTVTISAGAHVGGDVVSRYRPVIASRDAVDGEIRRESRLNVRFGQFTALSRILVWLATSVSSFLLGLLMVLMVPRAMDATARTASDRFGASIGFGLLALIGLPILSFVAIGILVGIPFGVGVLLALGLLYWLGYTAGAFAFGRRLVSAPANRVVSFLVGWGILRGLALIPVVASLTWLAATVWGLGAVVITARTAGRATPPAVRGPSGAAMPPIPPPPPMIQT
jgi:uncharacterized Zn-binding protein involved in type VI secretion